MALPPPLAAEGCVWKCYCNTWYQRDTAEVLTGQKEKLDTRWKHFGFLLHTHHSQENVFDVT